MTRIGSELSGCHINSLPSRQNGRHFADDTFKRIFINENVRISINISLKFVPEGLINNIPALSVDNKWYMYLCQVATGCHPPCGNTLVPVGNKWNSQNVATVMVMNQCCKLITSRHTRKKIVTENSEI